MVLKPSRTTTKEQTRENEMSRFRLTQDDLNRGKLVEPGLWYNAEVVKVYDDTVTIKGDEVSRTNVDMRIIDGPFVGAMLYANFNEKYPSYVTPFLKAFKIDVVADEDYELKNTQGMKLKVFVKHREWNNKMLNDVVDYRPFDS